MRNEPLPVSSPLTTLALAMLLALLVILVQTNTAYAHKGHLFYVGVTVPVERVDAAYDKTVDNTQARNPLKGQMFQDHDSDDTFAYGIGFLVGHRDAINPAKAGRTAGLLKKTGATVSRSSWAAAPGCCGYGTRVSTSSEASASSRRSLRITIEAACTS